MHELTITAGSRRLVLQPGQEAVVGRSTECQLVVDDPRVADRHVRISFGPQGWMLQTAAGSSTWVLGQPITGMVLNHSLEARLGTADGPSVVFGLPTPAAGPTAAAPPIHHPLTTGEVTTALTILVPLKSWIKNPGWHQGLRLLVIPYALLPLIFLIVFQNTGNLDTPGWAYSLYVAPLWAIAFWYLIKPGRLGWRELLIAVLVIAGTIAWMRTLTIWMNDHWFASNSFWSDIGTGYNEEIAKALPVLIVALALLLRWHRKLDVRMWMFMGTLAGLAFGVNEAATIYTSNAIVQVNQAHAASDAITAILLFAFRVFVDGFQHAIWAGIACFFIGLAVNYRARRIPLILFGVSVAAVLHGVNDWLAGLDSGLGQFGWIALNAVSLILFLGYSMSAHSIEERVAHDPLFGEQPPLASAPPTASPAPPTAAMAVVGAPPPPHPVAVPGAPPPPGAAPGRPAPGRPVAPS